ncbi:MAG: SDR family oxidoreductase [Deltaproteobacteria bacterium]|nr:SDR family oxidoreductase [Deltaproteobacteria bacterium]
MNNTVLITGATSGFGQSCARRFSENGWNLILIGRRTDRLDALKAELMNKSLVHIIPLDVRDREAVTAGLQNLPELFRNVDVLINSAGLALGLGPAHQSDLDDWDTMVDTNIKGLMYCTRSLLPGMVERNRGHIINMGSVAASYPYPGGHVYGATKAFVAQFSRNLRSDLLGTCVRVTNIEPGMAETEFSIVRFKGDASKADGIYQNTEPLTGTDIAEITYFVATLPEHININNLEVMPTCQAWAPLAVHREK